MEPIYLVDLVHRIASYNYVYENNDKGIKEGEFHEKSLYGNFNYLIGKYAY